MKINITWLLLWKMENVCRRDHIFVYKCLSPPQYHSRNVCVWLLARFVIFINDNLHQCLKYWGTCPRLQTSYNKTEYVKWLFFTIYLYILSKSFRVKDSNRVILVEVWGLWKYSCGRGRDWVITGTEVVSKIYF